MIKTCNIQKNNLLKTLFLLLIFGFGVGNTIFCQSNTRYVSSVAPTFWWTEMKQDTLQLLVHGNNLARAGVTIDKSEMIVAGVYNPENSNYLFVNLVRKEPLKPGVFTLKLSWPDTVIYIPYLLKARDKEFVPTGLDASDIIYLLMPDRFANGDTINDEISNMHQSMVDRGDPFARHGGDIEGILNHLNYLKNLHISALWLNPVEENNEAKESYHGYAITDHYRVDPRLGTNADYRKLSNELHKRDMKLIRDIVVNHFGDKHYLVIDPPSADWINSHDTFVQSNFRAPVLLDPHVSRADFEKFRNGWFDHHMPDMNLKNPYLAKYLIQNAVWWIENFHIDAYRIDTYAYADEGFMRQWAAAILKEYPGFFMFAETWVHGASIQAWFVAGSKTNPNAVKGIGSVTDFQMNYALNATFTEPFGWTEGVAKIYYALAKDYLYHSPENLVIFLDNHDVPRFAGVVNNDMEKIKSGIALLLTMRGIPQVLYGTEIGMSQTENHGLIREDFPGGWPADSLNYFDSKNLPEQAKEIFDFFGLMAGWRQNSAAVTKGKLIQFVPENGLYVYFRVFEKEVVMVALNASPKPQKLSLLRFDEVIQNSEQGVSVISGKKVPLTGHWDLQPYQTEVVSFTLP